MSTHSQQAVCDIGLIPVRAEASHRSEMVSMLLFGELYQILEEKESWKRIRMVFDSYEGWIDNSLPHILSEEAVQRYQDSSLFLAKSSYITLKGKQREFLVSKGSTLSVLPSGMCGLGNEEFEIEGEIIEFYTRDRSFIIETAREFLETPYLWGGRTIAGIDCSGFTQMVFKLAGYQLPRDAWQQAEVGADVKFDSTKPGDMAFFHNNNGRVTHVGIVIENQQIIHATSLNGSRVRIDRLTEYGIWNLNQRKMTHNLSCIRRLVT